MKKTAIVLWIVAIVAIVGVTGLKYSLYKLKLSNTIAEQNQILNNLTYVEDYSNNGTSVVIYVSELWLVGSNEDHIKWCNTVGNEMDKIYSKHMNKTLGNVYTHIYLNNNNGTVSELAWYKPVGNVELYYKH